MNAPVTRRSVIAGTAAALGAVALPVGVVDTLAAEGLCTARPTLTAFDPVAFLADLKMAGCRACLALPATVFRPGDRSPTYLISWPPQTGAFKSYCAVMAKWSEAMEACPDHVDLVAARLAERGEVTW